MNCCWHPATIQHLVMNHEDVTCCWCGESICISGEEQVGHGPYSKEILYPRPIRRCPLASTLCLCGHPEGSHEGRCYGGDDDGEPCDCWGYEEATP